MHNAGGVSCLERGGHLNGNVEDQPRSGYGLRHSLPQGFALNKLSNDKLGITFAPNFMDSNDVGMVQGRSSTSFLLKAAHSLSLDCEYSGQYFESNLAAQPGVMSQIHFAHAADSQHTRNLVVAQRLANLQ